MNQTNTTFRWLMFTFILMLSATLKAQISNNTITGAQTICTGSATSKLLGSAAIAGGPITYQWQISTTSSTLGFADISLATDTNYLAGNLTDTSWFRRVVSDGSSFDTSNTIEVTVIDYPHAAFTIANASQCLSGNQFAFTNKSTNSSQQVTWFWSFGDNNTDTVTNPSHSYTATGTFQVMLKAMNGFGCNDSTTTNVNVVYNPLASILTPAQTSFCGSGQQVTIYADTTNGDYHRNKLVIIYDASKGQSGLNGASKVYMHSGLSSLNTPGAGWTNVVGNWGQDDGIGEMTNIGGSKWRISIDVLNYYGLGINDSVKYIAMVFRNANGTATGKDNSGNDIFLSVGNNALNSSFNGVKGNYQQSFQWYKNNTLLSGETAASLMVNSTGDYSVEVNGHLGCAEFSSDVSLNFNPSVNMNAGLMNSYACFNNQNLSLYDSSTISSGSFTRFWEFGDGNSDTAAFPVHQYSSYGNYIIHLSLTSDKGCIVKDSFDFHLLPSVHAAIDSVPVTKVCGIGSNITLIADTSQKGYRSNKLILTYDAATGQSGLSGATKVYMHAGLSASNTPGSAWFNIVGNWGQDDGIGAMTNLGNNKWQIELDIDKYFNVDPRQSPNYLAFVFRNADGTATGKDGNGDDIFVSLQSLSPSATFNGVTAQYYQTYQWYRDDSLINAQNGIIYTADITGNYKLEVDGGLGCTNRTAGIRLTFGPFADAKLYTNVTEQCQNGNQFNFMDSSTIAAGSYTRVWNFGDGMTDTAAAPSHNYTNAATYTALLTITTDVGCISEDSVQITVNPSPDASASVNNAAQCYDGNKFDVQDQSSLSSGSYTVLWNWGDGFTDTTLTASHSFSAPANYFSYLTVTSDKGCIDTTGGILAVYPSPVASLSLKNSNAQCLNGNSFDFSDNTSFSGNYSRIWDLGNGSQDTSASFQYSYTNDGNYTVQLIIGSTNNCFDTAQVQIDVYPSPVFNVSVNAVTQCFNGNNFIVSDSSAIASGSYTRLWDFGDGTTDTAAIASHSYTTPGSYQGYLVLTTNHGCIDTTGGTLTVNPSPLAKGTIIGGPQCLNGNHFDFYDSSSIAQGYITRIWNFGDGKQDTNAVIIHNYNTYGKFMTQLIAVSDLGCTDTLTDTVIVYPHPAAYASLNSFDQCFNGNQFIAYDSTAMAYGTYTRIWNYGDGFTDTSAVSSHSYANPGNYIGYLLTTSDRGCRDSAMATIRVYESPKAKLLANMGINCFKNNIISFVDSSSIGSGNLTSVIYFGDNDSSINAPVGHRYASAGIYNAFIVTSSVNGCRDTARVNIQINENPVADFSINKNAQCLNGNSFSLTNNATISAGTLAYQWNFGDGNTDTAAAPSHSYNNDGNYSITFIATSNAGCTDTIVKSVEVSPMPVAKWSVNNNTQCLRGNSFSFSDSSIIKTGSLKWSWDFGNGLFDSISNPVVIYNTAQLYNVELTVTSDKGCVSKAAGVVTVNANPIATINANGSLNLCDGKNVLLKTVAGYLYQWMKNNANISGAIDSMLTVSASGDYKVVVSSQAGCADTSSNVTVTVSPKSNFGSFTGNTSVNANSTQTYSVVNVSGVTYNWSVTGGNVVSGQGNNAVQVQWGNSGAGRIILSADCYNNDTLNVNILSGISNTGTLFSAEVYPNPTNDVIQLKLPENIQFDLIQLFDLNGKLVYYERVNGRQQFSVDMQSLAAGVYQIVITGDGGCVRQKVVLYK